MEMEERDVVVFTDEDNNEIELDVIRYFEHKGAEYAILMDLNGEEEHSCSCGHEGCEDEGPDMYVMQVVENEEFEEFVPVEEEIFDEILEVIENLPDEE